MTVDALSPVALLGGTGMILVALAFFAYAAVRRLGWGYLALGALAWIVAVAFKFLWAIPLNTRLYAAITAALPGVSGAALFDLYVGLLTGFTEVGIVWLVVQHTRLGKATWERALAFGIGFGGVEALLLGLGSFATALTAILAPQVIPAQAMAQLTVMNNPLYEIAPIVERLFTVWVHIFANVLIFFAVTRAETRWFWLAFWFKSLFDGIAAFAQTSNVIATLQGIWAIEAVVVVCGLLALAGVRWVRPRYSVESLNLPGARRSAVRLATSGLLVLGLVGMTGAAAYALAPNSSGVTGSDRDAVLAYTEPKTDNLMQGLNRGEYAVFSRDLNNRMESAIGESGLVNVKNQVSNKVGDYVSRRVSSVSQSGDVVTVIYDAQFAQDDKVTMRVSFEAAEPHRISGLWFDSDKLRQ